MKYLPKKYLLKSALLSSLLLILPLTISLPKVFAVTDAQQAYVRLDRMAASSATGGEVCWKPSVVTSIKSLDVTFPTGYSLSATTANWAAITTGIDSGSTAFPTIASATVTISSQTATYTLSSAQAVVVGTLYCFLFGQTTPPLTHPGSPASSEVGTITSKDASAVAIDTKRYATVTTSSAGDQITVNAQVPPTFTFSLTGTTANFTSDLSTSSVVSTNTITGNIATNAQNGWVAYVKGGNDAGGANAGYSSLKSLSTGGVITRVASATVNNSPEDLNSNTGYVLNVNFTDSATSGTGTVSQASNYGAEYANGATTGGTISTSFQPVAAANGATDGDAIALTARAKISALQPAGNDYQDTLTVVAAARY